ncbi:hypothetical protein CEQ07_10065 [Oligella urethralis]|nr:hypothetical protein CEQ07_10065 [Oligella urethralis]
MASVAQLNSVSCQLSFILHAITGLRRLSLNHYYGIICHLTLTSILAFALHQCSHIVGTVPGFPSYCVDSL